ncbi:hypothetical protein BaRGS_00004805 [Batillaria attramentaria]|uniref:Uncharacterized protein n=1 Tax=Batillaria attramentaria TaxID=370345 RepID=A0ABD0LY89_9CAEN
MYPSQTFCFTNILEAFEARRKAEDVAADLERRRRERGWLTEDERERAIEAVAGLQKTERSLRSRFGRFISGYRASSITARIESLISMPRMSNFEPGPGDHENHYHSIRANSNTETHNSIVKALQQLQLPSRMKTPDRQTRMSKGERRALLEAEVEKLLEDMAKVRARLVAVLQVDDDDIQSMYASNLFKRFRFQNRQYQKQHQSAQNHFQQVDGTSLMAPGRTLQEGLKNNSTKAELFLAQVLPVHSLQYIPYSEMIRFLRACFMLVTVVGFSSLRECGVLFIKRVWGSLH